MLHLRGVFLANGFNFWEQALKYPLSLVFVQLVSVSAVIVCVLCLTKRELESWANSRCAWFFVILAHKAMSRLRMRYWRLEVSLIKMSQVAWPANVLPFESSPSSARNGCWSGWIGSIQIGTVWSVARASAVKSENVTLRNEIATQWDLRPFMLCLLEFSCSSIVS